MAINFVNAQGTQAYVIPGGTDVSTCELLDTAIGTAAVIGCPQTIGNLEETRNVTEYTCISSNESVKSLGSITRGSLELGLLLDPQDTAGQAELKAAFASNDEIIIALELSDMPSGGNNGTRYHFSAYVSAVSTGIEKDSAVTYTVTVEISSAITECPAT